MSNVTKAVFKRFGTLIHAYFSWILPYSKNPSREPINIKFKKLKYFINKLNKSLNIEMHVNGLDTIPEDVKSAFLPNHMSAYDPMVISSVLNDGTTYLSKVENKKIPLVGRIITAMEGCFLDRKNFQKAVATMLYIEKDLKEQNKNWVIFPEGTRQKDPYAPLLEFHKGSISSIMKAKAPIVPVALYGTHNALKSDYKLKKYPIYLTFLKPVMPSDYEGKTPDDICDLIKNQIQNEVNAERRLYHERIKDLFKTKRALNAYNEKQISLI